MVDFTGSIINIFLSNPLKFISTASESGIPNVAAIGSPIVDPQNSNQIFIANAFLNKTAKNLEKNEYVMILFHTPLTQEMSSLDVQTYQVAETLIDEIDKGLVFKKFKEQTLKTISPRASEILKSVLVIHV